jgi:hypothetical protein
LARSKPIVLICMWTAPSKWFVFDDTARADAASSASRVHAAIAGTTGAPSRCSWRGLGSEYSASPQCVAWTRNAAAVRLTENAVLILRSALTFNLRKDRTTGLNRYQGSSNSDA